MRYSPFVLLLLLGYAAHSVLGCAARRLPIAPPTQMATSHVISLVGLDTLGHACPCDGTVYTARHVAFEKEDPQFFTWEDQNGNSGTAKGVWKDPYRDLGRVETYGAEPVHYLRAKTDPKRGSRVLWIEYEPNAKRALLSRERSAKVLYSFAGYIAFDAAPTSGASGSCLFNEKGAVVGVVVWAISIGTAQAGVAVSIVK